jgi:hypothetical protein
VASSFTIFLSTEGWASKSKSAMRQGGALAARVDHVDPSRLRGGEFQVWGVSGDRLQRLHLVAVRYARDRLIADVSRSGRPSETPGQLEAAREVLRKTRQRLQELVDAARCYTRTEIGDAARRAEETAQRLAELQRFATSGGWLGAPRESPIESNEGVANHLDLVNRPLG